VDIFALTIRVTVLLLIALLIGGLLRKRPALCHTVLLGGLLAAFAVPLLELSRSGLQLPTHVVHLTTAAAPDPVHLDSAVPQPVAEIAPLTLPMSRPQEPIGDPVESELPPESGVVAMSPQQENSRPPIQFQLPQWTWSGIVLTVWILGALFRVAGLGRAAWCLRRLVNESENSPAAANLGLHRFRVRLSQSLSVPIAVGIVRPVVLLPQELTTELSASQLQAVLLHEAAHLRRKDPLTVLLQEFLASILWRNPIVHLFNRSLTQAREDVCDTIALSASSRESYSEALLHIAGRPPKYTSRIVTAGSSGQLAKRVAFILTEGRNMMTTVSKHVAWTVFSVYLVFACVLTLTSVTMRPAEAEQPQSEARAAKEMITITGQVLDPNGKPVPAAPVSVMVRRQRDNKYRHPEDRAELAHEKTDRNGRFQFKIDPLSPPVDVALTVYTVVPNYAPAWEDFDVYGTSREISLKLVPDSPRKAKIVDGSGNPVVNARVALRQIYPYRTKKKGTPWWDLSFPSDPRSLSLPTLRSSDQGEILLRGTTQKVTRAQFDVHHPDFASQRVTFDPSKTDTLTVELNSDRTPMFGTLVHGETKKPAAGVDVTVVAFTGDRFINGMDMAGVVTGKTDAQGRFRVIPYVGIAYSVGVVEADDNFVRLLHWKEPKNVLGKSLSLVLPDGVTFKTDEIATARRATRYVSVSGTAAGPDGEPIKVGTVITSHGTRGEKFGIRNGQFYIPKLVRDKTQNIYLVDVENDLGATVNIVPKDNLRINVQLSPCASATVRHVDELGKPYSNVDVLSNNGLGLHLVLLLESGTPLGNCPELGEQVYKVYYPGNAGMHRIQRTDGEGRLTYRTIIPGASYRKQVSGPVLVHKNGLPVVAGEKVSPQNVEVLGRSKLTKWQFRAKSGEQLDLGTYTFRRKSNPDKPVVDFDRPAGASRPLGTPAELADITAKVVQLAKKVTPAVVRVRPGNGDSGASGVVVSEDGYVLTAAHLFGTRDEDARPGEKVTIVFPDGTSAPGKALGMCPTLDIALVKITEQGRKWPFVEKGVSGNLHSADWCMFLGYPNRFDREKSRLVVRIGRVTGVAKDTVWTTCTAVSGDSGGPLFDINGRVIGIHKRSTRHPSIDAFERNWDRLVNGDLWTIYDPD